MSTWDDEKYEVKLPAASTGKATSSAAQFPAILATEDTDWVRVENNVEFTQTKSNWKAHRCPHCHRNVCLIWTGGECRVSSRIPPTAPPAPANEAGSNRTDIVPLSSCCEFCQQHSRYHCEVTKIKPQTGAFESSEDKINFQPITDKIMLQIFSFLPGYVLAKGSVVCKRFYRISNDLSLWQRQFEKINKDERNRSLFQTIKGNPQTLEYMQEAYNRWYMRNSPICIVCEKYCRRLSPFVTDRKKKVYLCQNCEKREYISADKAISHFRLDELDLSKLESFPKRESPEQEITYYKFLHVYYTAYWKSRNIH